MSVTFRGHLQPEIDDTGDVVPVINVAFNPFPFGGPPAGNLMSAKNGPNYAGGPLEIFISR